MASNRLIADVDRQVLRTSIAAAALCLVTFFILRLLLLLFDGPSPFDIWLSDHIRQPHPSQGLKIVEHLAALPGSSKGAAALILVVAAWAWLRRRDVRPGVLLIAAVVVAKASVEVLKVLLVHVMPMRVPIGERVNRAFLSSHVTVAVALLAMLAVVIWVFGHRDLFFLAVAVAIVLVIAVALSVMATDKHYFVDVVSGAAVGGFWVAVFAPVGDLMWRRFPAPISPASSREIADQVYARDGTSRTGGVLDAKDRASPAPVEAPD
jgi:membrane-associated phospholipid phosphatase